MPDTPLGRRWFGLFVEVSTDVGRRRQWVLLPASRTSKNFDLFHRTQRPNADGTYARIKFDVAHFCVAGLLLEDVKYFIIGYQNFEITRIELVELPEAELDHWLDQPNKFVAHVNG